MSDMRVSQKSSFEIEQVALSVRDLFGMYNDHCPEIVWALEAKLPTIIKEFALIPDGSALSPFEDAKTFYDPLRIELHESLYTGALSGVPLARHTLGHETGHVFLHRDQAKAWDMRRKEIKSREHSAEWQANEFSYHYLCPRHIVYQYESIEEIEHWLKVPRKLAERAFKEYSTKPREIPTYLRDILGF
uniref:ImmA/IrrE family metallo-endopeptidase n=1 Tax=Pararhizobium sp. IMCC3301 TaxID=3067904 RepID=UPI002740FA93|nr:ImmA/IrrE family metallo-endopeptidase [Pararhizobium sp. IMCC3301]